MKIVNGIIAQLPYTPPRTQLCIVELEDVCVTASGEGVKPVELEAVDVKGFTDVEQQDPFKFDDQDFTK